MLEYLEFQDTATALRRAIRHVYAAGKVLTPDQGGSGKTYEFCDAVHGAMTL
jgi:isocitrate/isopropylmalate dehydrogenase